MAVYLGLFSDIHRLGEAIRQEANRILVDYLNHGSYGHSFDKIQANLVGVIKASVTVHSPQGRVTDQTQVSYHFCIRTIDSHARNMQVHMGPTEAARLPDEFYGNRRQGIAIPESPTPMRTVKHGQPLATQNQLPTPAPVGIQHDEERSPEWARTRVPLFDRRDDGPFRRPSDPPYEVILGRSLPSPTTATNPIEQAAEPTDDEKLRVDSVTASCQGSPTSKPEISEAGDYAHAKEVLLFWDDDG